MAHSSLRFSPFASYRFARSSLGRITPGMFQAFYELPQCAVERRRHTEFFTAICDRAVHEVLFRLALRKNILQHAGLVLAGSIGAFLHQRARVAVKLYAERLGDRLALGD